MGENFQANQPAVWQNTHYLMHDALCCITAEAKSNVNWDFEVSKSYNKDELRISSATHHSRWSTSGFLQVGAAAERDSQVL